RLDRGALVLGLSVRELGLEPLEPFVLELVGDTGRLLAARVEREQLAGQLAQARAGAALQVLPGLAAELRQRRRARVGADVLRDLADLLVRDVEPVVSAETEEEVVARDLRDGLRLEAEQLPDSMVFVDDEVAGAQVGEALQGAAGRGRARAKPASSFSASARPRAAIAGRCASNACACPRGNDSSSALPSSETSVPSSAQTSRTCSGSQTRSGGRSSGGTRSSGTGAGSP